MTAKKKNTDTKSGKWNPNPTGRSAKNFPRVEPATRFGQEPKLTTREAAEFLRMARPTLEMWRQKGKGPQYLKIGGSVFYYLSKLIEFEKSCVTNSTCEVA